MTFNRFVLASTLLALACVLLCCVTVQCSPGLPASVTAPRPTPPPPTDSPQEYLRGVSFDEARRHFAGGGLTCPAPTLGQLFYATVCAGSPGQASLSGQLNGPSAERVRYVSATIQQTQPDAALTVKFLTHIAALPYEGADPDAARLWVHASLQIAPDRNGVHAERDFGPAHFLIAGSARSRLLEMVARPGS